MTKTIKCPKYSCPGIFLVFLMSCSSVFSQESVIVDFSKEYPDEFRYNAGEEETAGPKIPGELTDFSESSLMLFNKFGSFSFRDNGLKVSAGTNRNRFFTSYLYRNYDGFRNHSEEYWNILDIGLQTAPSINTNLTLFGSYLSGRVKLPGH